MTRVLISACLLGRACRYDGRHERVPALTEQLERDGITPVPFCPEEAGGLGTPRPPSVLVGGDGDAVAAGTARVVTREEGRDVTEAYLSGALQAVEAALQAGCAVAYLKERSPSCGCALVHTRGGLVDGCGVTTALLRRAGIATVSVG